MSRRCRLPPSTAEFRYRSVLAAVPKVQVSHSTPSIRVLFKDRQEFSCNNGVVRTPERVRLQQVKAQAKPFGEALTSRDLMLRLGAVIFNVLSQLGGETRPMGLRRRIQPRARHGTDCKQRTHLAQGFLDPFRRMLQGWTKVRHHMAEFVGELIHILCPESSTSV